MSRIKAMQQALDALLSHVSAYPHMDKGYMVDAREALREALTEDTLQQHATSYQEMEQSDPTDERTKLISRLRLGASILRDRGINEDFAAIADDAADMLGADAAWYAKGDRLMNASFSPLFSAGQWWADRPWGKKT
jgi:hypothetical protein